jgi:hypothetical protein
MHTFSYCLSSPFYQPRSGLPFSDWPHTKQSIAESRAGKSTGRVEIIARADSILLLDMSDVCVHWRNKCFPDGKLQTKPSSIWFAAPSSQPDAASTSSSSTPHAAETWITFTSIDAGTSIIDYGLYNDRTSNRPTDCALDL